MLFKIHQKFVPKDGQHQSALTMLGCQPNDDVEEVFVNLLQKSLSVIVWVIQMTMSSCNANESVGCVVQVGIMHHGVLKPNSIL